MKTFSSPALLTSAVAILLGTACSGSVSLGEMNDGEGTAGSASASDGQGGRAVELGGTGGGQSYPPMPLPLGGEGGVGGTLPAPAPGGGGHFGDLPCQVHGTCLGGGGSGGGNPCEGGSCQDPGGHGGEGPEGPGCANPDAAECTFAEPGDRGMVTSTATDGTHVFVAYHGPRNSVGDYMGPGTVVRMNTDGSDATVVAELPGPVKIAVTDGYVYARTDMDGFDEGVITGGFWRIAREADAEPEALPYEVTDLAGHGSVASWDGAGIQIWKDGSDAPAALPVGSAYVINAVESSTMYLRKADTHFSIPLDGTGKSVIGEWSDCNRGAWFDGRIYCVGRRSTDNSWRVVSAPDTGGAWTTRGLMAPMYAGHLLMVNGERGAVVASNRVSYWRAEEAPGDLHVASLTYSSDASTALLIGKYVIYSHKAGLTRILLE